MTATPETLARILTYTARDRWPNQRCVAWVERGEHNCGKHAIDWLCTMHLAVAHRKWERMVAEKTKELADLKVKRELRLAANIHERGKIRARIQALDPDTDHDTQAYAGNTHRSIERQRLSRLSDTRVAELGRLVERLNYLNKQIGDQRP